MTDDVTGCGPEPIRRVLRRALCEPVDTTPAASIADELHFAEEKIPAALDLFRVIVGAEHATFVLDRIMTAIDGPWACIPDRGLVALEPIGASGRCFQIRSTEWEANQQVEQMMQRQRHWQP